MEYNLSTNFSKVFGKSRQNALVSVYVQDFGTAFSLPPPPPPKKGKYAQLCHFS